MTDAERALWRALRETYRELHCRHQVPLGDYIVDFCSHRARLVIETDGGQHATEASQAYDADRTSFIEEEGYRVLRFWNHDALADTDAVIQAIEHTLSGGARQ